MKAGSCRIEKSKDVFDCATVRIAGHAMRNPLERRKHGNAAAGIQIIA